MLTDTNKAVKHFTIKLQESQGIKCSSDSALLGVLEQMLLHVVKNSRRVPLLSFIYISTFFKITVEWMFSVKWSLLEQQAVLLESEGALGKFGIYTTIVLF